MERIKCEEIVVESYAVGTTDVMEYADEHPNEYFDFTSVHSKHTDFGWLMVSEYEPDEDSKEFFEDRFQELSNGWQRYRYGYVFVCRKGERYIIITS